MSKKEPIIVITFRLSLGVFLRGRWDSTRSESDREKEKREKRLSSALKGPV